MFATSKNVYTEVFRTLIISTIYIYLKKVIEPSILSAHYHTNLKGGAGRRMPRIRKKLFHAKSTPGQCRQISNFHRLELMQKMCRKGKSNSASAEPTEIRPDTEIS